MNIKVMCGELEIRVDRRTELLGIIQIISNYKLKYSHLLEKHGNRQYVEEIELKFSSWKNHQTIKLFNEIIEKLSFNYDAPVNLFLQLNMDFTYSELSDYPFKKRLKSASIVLEFLDSLPEFAKIIGFNEYYISNHDLYRDYVNCIKINIGDMKLSNFFTKYYGISTSKNLVVNLIPWQTKGNYGTNNNTEIHCNICSSSQLENSAYTSDYRKVMYASLLFHEFSHSYINPLTEKYDIIEEKDPIFSNIFDRMQAMVYGQNKSIINEHIIRALTVRWYDIVIVDPKEKERLIAEELIEDFIYLKNIINSLKHYENNRDKYVSIDDYYPVIIENVIKESKSIINSNCKKEG